MAMNKMIRSRSKSNFMMKIILGYLLNNLQSLSPAQTRKFDSAEELPGKRSHHKAKAYKTFMCQIK